MITTDLLKKTIAFVIVWCIVISVVRIHHDGDFIDIPTSSE